MKKIFTYILGMVVALTGLSSCHILDTESPSAFGAETVFSNYDLVEGNIFGIVEAFCEVNSYRGRFLPWYGLNTDIEWYNSYKPGDGKSDIAAYQCEPNNSQLNLTNGPYPLMYTAIERANLTIAGLREYADIEHSADLAYLLGEALTLRAMVYYDMIKAWGDIPARFEAVTSETIYLPKSSRDVIFKQILADLEEAIPYLPYPGKTAQTSRTDRINKVFAEGLYARIALAASGYAIRPDDGKEGTGDLGTVRLSNAPELQKSVLYPKALAYLEDAIQSKSASLEPDYKRMWYNLNNLNNLVAGPGKETLYVIPFGTMRGRWNFTFAVKSENSLFSNGVDRGGDAGPVPTVYFMYDKNDVRRDVTCVNYYWDKNTMMVPAGIGKWYFGKFRYEWMDAYPYGGGNDDGVKPVVMRYADILLMAAEIANAAEGGNDLAKAKRYFEEVRSRACGEDAAEAYVGAIGSQEEMFQAIVKERALEFCGEMLRKGDLIRWNLLKSKLDEAIAAMKDLRSLSGDYAFLAGNAGNVWYREGEDGISLEFYGLDPSEAGAPDGSDWTLEAACVNKFDDNKNTGFYASRIEGIYLRDPEQYMFWPIFSDSITNSQGALVNDYGY